MKVTKLIVGIIMIVLAIIIFVQSIVRGFGNPNPAIHIYAGTAELIVSLLYLASGIVYIATCGIDGLGGDIAGLSMMLISWVLGLLTCTIYLHTTMVMAGFNYRSLLLCLAYYVITT